ncbi:PF04235 family protein [Actinomyces naeslundii str. Howell 279]|nr:PF04235 family protein [Actinomyces naeslundii str. Howell 279]
MLLLISLANITFWTGVARVSAPNDASDTAWLWVRTLLIDARSYPLFAMLFGFGLATMVNRRIASGTENYLQSLPGVEAGREPTAQEEVWAREQATVDARRLVRRRGLWMVLFGAAHAVLFSGDVIAAYGLVAVIFAGWLARKHWKRAAVLCAVVVVACVVITFVIESFMTSQGAASATDMRAGGGESATTLLSYVSHGVTSWAVNLSTTPISLVVPAMFLGARLADTDLIAHPERHRRLLTGVGLGGLGIGAVGGIGVAQWATGGSLNLWAVPLHQVAGLAGACGWLALLALYAGGPRPDGRLTGLRKLASNVGRRSMTAYLSQTFLFATIFLALPALTGIQLHLGEVRAAGIAVAVWLVTVGLCAVLERGGHAGPFETLLRTAVARSERERATAAPPTVQPDDA